MWYGICRKYTWWRHQMETFSALLALCTGNSPVTGEFPAQRPVTRSFDVFFDLLLNKRLSKQLWGWWFETASRSLWRHCDEFWKLGHHQGPLLRTWMNFNPAWMNNHMLSKVWDEITYPFPNFNGCTVVVWEWIRNFTFYNGCNWLSMLWIKFIHVSKRGSMCSRVMAWSALSHYLSQYWIIEN